MSKSRNVMVIYGHCEPLNNSVKTILRRMGLRPLDWHQLILATDGGSPYNLEILEKAVKEVQAVVAILYGEEEAKLIPALRVNGKSQRGFQPRANVIFEVGMTLPFMREKTFLLEFGSVRIWSDIHGLHRITFREDMQDDLQRRQELFHSLKKAGCDVDETDSSFLDKKIEFKCSHSALK